MSDADRQLAAQLLAALQQPRGYEVARGLASSAVRATADGESPAMRALALAALIAPAAGAPLVEDGDEQEVRPIHLSLARLLITTAGGIKPVPREAQDAAVAHAVGAGGLHPIIAARALQSLRCEAVVAEPGAELAATLPPLPPPTEETIPQQAADLAHGAGTKGELAVCRWLLAGNLVAAAAAARFVQLRATHEDVARWLVRALVAQGEIKSATELAKKQPPLDRALVHALIQQRERKAAAKAVKSMGFSVDEFPELVEMQRLAQLRWTVREHNLELAEGIASSDPASARDLCRMMIEAHGADDSVVRAVVHRFGLAAEFPDVPAEDTAALEAAAAAADAGCVRLGDYVPDARVHWVGSADELRAAGAAMLAAPVVGLDSEWEPWRKDKHACALLQLATAEDVFLVDVPALPGDALADVLGALFESPDVLKVGYDLASDLRELRHILMPDAARAPDAALSLLDLRRVQRALAVQLAGPGGQPSREQGLTSLCQRVLGKPLSKQVRLSNWSRRPLSPAQRHYAALDAFVLVELRRHMMASGLLTAEKEAELRTESVSLSSGSGSSRGGSSGGGPSSGGAAGGAAAAESSAGAGATAAE